MATQTIFQRHEKKYLLAGRQFQQLRALLAAPMQGDQYGRHTIGSIYYDTDEFLCARRQTERADYREKLRLRSYGVPSAETTVYLELKKKLDGVTYKRRMGLPYAEAMAYLQHGTPPQNTGQVFGEIDWFIRQNAPQPKVLICYDRVALYGRQDSGLRITFDESIRFRTNAPDMAQGDQGTALLPSGQVLMEIKTATAFPLWLSRALSQLQIFPVSFSKYRTVYHRLQAGMHPVSGAQAADAPQKSAVRTWAAPPLQVAKKEVLWHA